MCPADRRCKSPRGGRPRGCRCRAHQRCRHECSPHPKFSGSKCPCPSCFSNQCFSEWLLRSCRTSGLSSLQVGVPRMERYIGKPDMKRRPIKVVGGAGRDLANVTQPGSASPAPSIPRSSYRWCAGPYRSASCGWHCRGVVRSPSSPNSTTDGRGAGAPAP